MKKQGFVLRKCIAAFLIFSIISPQPAFAISQTRKTVSLVDIKARGIEEEVSLETVEVISPEENNVAEQTTNQVIEEEFQTGAEEVTETDAVQEEVLEQTTQDYDSTSEEPIEENAEEEQRINTDGVVIQKTNYTCGPAALATVLNNLGIKAAEEELAILAKTDELGTTMSGLAQAAKEKDLNAVGMKLSTGELRENNIVFVTIGGEPHYSVVKEVREDSVLLADPLLGNIELSKEEFNLIYSGNALVVNLRIKQEVKEATPPITKESLSEDLATREEAEEESVEEEVPLETSPEQLNTEETKAQATEQAEPSFPQTTESQTNETIQAANKTLTDEEMREIEGRGAVVGAAIGGVIGGVAGAVVSRKTTGSVNWRYVAGGVAGGALVGAGVGVIASAFSKSAAGAKAVTTAAGSGGVATVKAVGDKITGYTNHGLAQAIGRDGGRGVSPAAIVNAVRNPVNVVNQAANGTTKYVGNSATVILNNTGRVVTAWARNLSGVRGGR